MNELLTAATRAFNAIADYYEKEANPLKPVQARLPLGEAAPSTDAAEKAVLGDKPKRTRRTKAQIAADETQADAPQAGNVGIDMGLGDNVPAPNVRQTDAELAAKSENLAQAFVMRFKAAQPTGVERAKALLKELGVERLGHLDREGNIKFAAKIEKELAAA